MAEFRIHVAGYTAAVHSLFESTRDYCRDYLTEEDPAFTIVIQPEDLVLEQQLLLEEALEEGFRPRRFPDPFLERSSIQRKFADYTLYHGTILFHGSAISADGQGFIFAAKSGTGKSTHARLWQRLLGTQAVMINDDKPFITVTGKHICVCGAPWSGKHGLDTNIRVPLKGICFLQRGSENRIRRLSIPEALPLLRDNGCPPLDARGQTAYYALLDAVAAGTDLWQMECTKDPQAAAVAYGAMTGKGF